MGIFVFKIIVNPPDARVRSVHSCNEVWLDVPSRIKFNETKLSINLDNIVDNNVLSLFDRSPSREREVRAGTASGREEEEIKTKQDSKERDESNPSDTTIDKKEKQAVLVSVLLTKHDEIS